MWAIVGSSGFEQFDEFEILEELPRETPFGLCSNGFYRLNINGIETLFLCRTSKYENLLPVNINYRANVYALKKYGATAVLALSSVRSLHEDLKPGDMVIPYQYLDQTKVNRGTTFCDNGIMAYVSLTHPISEDIANELQQQQTAFPFKIHFNQVCVCIDGPQFPTMIEASWYRSMGSNIVAMTPFPEFILAREAGLHYLPCNFVIDYVPWKDGIENSGSILQTRSENYDKAKSIIHWIIKSPKYGQIGYHELNIAPGINAFRDQLSPTQKSWLNIIAKREEQPSFDNKILTTIDLYHEIRPLPEKLQNLLNFVNKYRKNVEETVESVRHIVDSSVLYAGEKIAIASVRDFSVKLEGRDIHVRLYHPDPQKVLPIIVFTHGGGFVSGTIDSYDAPCRQLAEATQYVVASIGYRLAPEFPYPAGLHDLYHTAKWLYQHANELKATQEGFTMIGDSSGGNYTALCVDRSVQTKEFSVANQVLIYPTTDLSHNTQSMHTFSQGFLLEAKRVLWYNQQYLPNNTIPVTSPEVSPLYLTDLSHMPRTFVITAGYDPLRDEGILFAQKLGQLGVDMHHYHFDNMIHGFMNFSKLVPDEAKILYQRIASFLKNS